MMLVMKMMSVAKMVDAGNEVHFGKDSWVHNIASNTYTSIHRENDVYVMEFKVLESREADKRVDTISSLQKEADLMSGNIRQEDP